EPSPRLIRVIVNQRVSLVVAVPGRIAQTPAILDRNEMARLLSLGRQNARGSCVPQWGVHRLLEHHLGLEERRGEPQGAGGGGVRPGEARETNGEPRIPALTPNPVEPADHRRSSSPNPQRREAVAAERSGPSSIAPATPATAAEQSHRASTNSDAPANARRY